MTTHDIAIQNELRMEWEQARVYCKDWSYQTVDCNGSEDFDGVTLFIGENKHGQMSLFIRIESPEGASYEILPLMKNPELFDIIDGSSYHMDELLLFANSVAPKDESGTCRA